MPDQTAHQQAQAARLLTLFTYVEHSNGSFLLCRSCRAAVPSALIPRHLSSTTCHSYRKKDCDALLQAWEAVYGSTCSIAVRTEADAVAWQQRQKKASTHLSPAAAVQELPLCYALQCKLSDPATSRRCQFLDGYTRRMRAHCYTVHAWGEEPKQGQSIRLKEGQALPWEERVPAQRLQSKGKATGLWRIALAVAPAKDLEAAAAGAKEKGKQAAGHQIWADLEAKLAQGHTEKEKADVQAASSTRYPVHISPWIEKTGWAIYLQAYRLEQVAQLLDPPAADEPGLAALYSAFDALIESARMTALEEDQVNTFALHRVNSFRQGQSFRKPLLVKLLDATYRQYRAVWHRLLSFVYRLTVLGRGPNLRYVLTPQQQQALANLPPSPVAAAASLSIEGPDRPTDPPIRRLPPLSQRPESSEQDQIACLELCIALLNHRIRGRLTDSIVVGFLAANGINRERKGFDGATLATSDLSALIKLAQLLVLQYAVHEHRSGRADFPGDKVAELQDAFMVYGSDSPINWILNLRNYGTAIRNNTTAAGWIKWCDDGQKLSYKSLELSLHGLRWAIRDQLTEAQEHLDRLLLLPDAEPDARARLVPAVDLAQLKDDPGVSTAGLSFLLDPRNRALLAAGGQRYLLNRIRDSRTLRGRFFLCENTLAWDSSAIQAYIRLVHVYLERLLLLVHISGGQPARATELLTLRWRNSTRCDIRSVFVDNGMLCFVTSYHKNYSTSSTTRIVHRYLPAEVGELLLYYLWLITPFLDALHVLSEDCAWQAPDIGSYLWPDSLLAATGGRKIDVHVSSSHSQQAHATHSTRHVEDGQKAVEEPWPSSRLGAVIKERLAAALSTTITVLLWRHAAIAMSRKHLPEGFQFRCDYGAKEGDAIVDLQSAHTSKRAAITYARSRDEGPGFSKTIRDDYRSLSRAWHVFLGFGAELPPRDNTVAGTALEPTTAASTAISATIRKRMRDEVEGEGGLRGWAGDEQLPRLKRKTVTNLGAAI